MSIKRYKANQDNTITNAFGYNLTTRATGSNMGASDILEVFSIYGQASSSSLEASRVLVQFPISQIVSDRAASKLPSSGSVDFILRMFNAEHSETLPKQFTLIVNPLSRSWQEGIGLDMDGYLDKTRDGDGSNWINASNGTQWSSQGGDTLQTTFSQNFDSGEEDLEVNVTSLVESWINGSTPNYGLLIRLTGSQENQNRSFYTKRFFSRSSEHFFKRPIIEARWDSTSRDERNRFYVSSSLLSQADNTHSVYLYNYVRGQLKNIANVGTGSIYVQVYTSASDGSLITTIPSVVTGGYVSTGIYSASFVLDTTSSIVYDRWFVSNTSYHTGTIRPLKYDSLESQIESKKYISSLTNLKSSYSPAETARIRMFVRQKNWSPNIYTVASVAIPNIIIDNVYYKLLRLSDNSVIIDYGTGSLNHTRLSYDTSGNFFDFDFSMLEARYSYGFKFMFLIDGNYEEQDGIFKFRVEDTI